MFLWRISNHPDRTGEGGLRASGRCHTRGPRVVYCSETPSAALLEILVHLEAAISEWPVRYRLLKLEAPDELAVEAVSVSDLREGWAARPDVTRAIGDAWISSVRTPLLRVPSVLVPETFNVLLNPGHRYARRIALASVIEHPIDPRLV